MGIDEKIPAATIDPATLPRHVAIIMDGNGRWAQKRGLPRQAGHKKGVDVVREIVKASRDFGIEYLTLYSFSSENWKRPKSEIKELFSLLKIFVRKDLSELHQNNVRVRIIGVRDGLPDDVVPLLEEAETLTKGNDGQTLVIAFNYGAREEIVRAAQTLADQVARGELQAGEITSERFSGALGTDGIPDPDLLIRTSGEVRISNFLLWQIAYTELVFVDCLWPDFDRQAYQDALKTFVCRERKFGGLIADADA